MMRIGRIPSASCASRSAMLALPIAASPSSSSFCCSSSNSSRQQIRSYSAKLRSGGPSPHGPDALPANVCGTVPGSLTAAAAPATLRKGASIVVDMEEDVNIGKRSPQLCQAQKKSNNGTVSSFSVFTAPSPSNDLRPISDGAGTTLTLFTIVTNNSNTAGGNTFAHIPQRLYVSLRVPFTESYTNGPKVVEMLVCGSKREAVNGTNTKRGDSTTTLISTTTTPSSLEDPNLPLFKVSLPIETILDNDAVTFDSNVQRHSIVSPTVVDGSQCSIRNIREIRVPSGASVSFADRLKEVIANSNTDNDNNKSLSNASSQRYILFEWNSREELKSLQPTHSPYAILADDQGIRIDTNNANPPSSSSGNGDAAPFTVRYSAVPMSAFESIARVIVDALTEAPASAEKDSAAATNCSIASRCFDTFSEEPLGGSLSPHFYRNMRVLPHSANVFMMQQREKEANMSKTASSGNSKKAANKTVSSRVDMAVTEVSPASSPTFTLPQLVPLDKLYWDHAMLYGHPPQQAAAQHNLCGCFDDGCADKVLSDDKKSSHETLRANMRRMDAPEVATVRIDSTSIVGGAENSEKRERAFAEASRRLIMTIENFGFGVMEDNGSLGGLPPLPLKEEKNGKQHTKPLIYEKPLPPPASATSSSDASAAAVINNSNTRLVDFRAQKAEQLITRVFGYARNCHYGLFSTWSNGSRWKHEDLSDDAVLMAQVDAFNLKHGHKTSNLALSSQKKAPSKRNKNNRSGKAHEADSNDLQVLNKSGSDPHADGAYSGIHLDLHTDNTYFVDVPRLQAFGCIFTHTTRTTGGESNLVDGARVALEIARLCSPTAAAAAAPTLASRKVTEQYSIAQRRRFLDLLCTVPIAGRFEKEQHYYNGLKPVINLTRGATPSLLIELAAAIPAASTNADGSVSEQYVAWCRKLQTALGASRPLVDSISFNNSDRAPLNPFVSKAFMSAGVEKGIIAQPNTPSTPSASIGAIDLIDPAKVKEYYQAYEWFHCLVHDPELAIHFTLKPGQMLFFDNHRVLHGRLEFSGPRVMCGSYVANDEYFSSLKAACNAMNREELAMQQ